MQSVQQAMKPCACGPRPVANIRQARPACGVSGLNSQPFTHRLHTERALFNSSNSTGARLEFAARAGSSSRHVHGGGGRAGKELQQAENEVRGEINDLLTDLGRIDKKAAELEGRPGDTVDFPHHDYNERNGSNDGAAALQSVQSAAQQQQQQQQKEAPPPPLQRPEAPPPALKAAALDEQKGGNTFTLDDKAEQSDRAEQSHKAEQSGKVEQSRKAEHSDNAEQADKGQKHSGRAGEDVQGEMLKPSVVNTPWARIAAIAVGVVLAGRGTALLSARAVAYTHLLSFALWFGANTWTTFVAGITMFKNLPRQTFGRLQAKLFPLYFQLTSAAIALMFGTLTQSAIGVPKSQVITLGVALAASLANLVYVEPTATRVMFERYDLENAKGERDSNKIQALYKTFGKYHGLSSMLNLVVTVAAFVHGWWLAGGLVLHTV